MSLHAPPLSLPPHLASLSAQDILNTFSRMTPLETTLLLSPILLYAVFSAYRARNPSAKVRVTGAGHMRGRLQHAHSDLTQLHAQLSDFIFAIATVAVFFNLFSIVVLKTRYF